MSSEYRPPSSRKGFIAIAFGLGVVALIALLIVMFVSGMFMHGNR